MNIVILGHVDHGKSTLIGRLMADTNSLPEGKLEAIKKICANNSKEFEYAFLLDALKQEREQGITIDVARCFFQSAKRQYLILDAPGHIEFLKNLVNGVSRAEAAILLVDASEGIRENTTFHGLLASMLGIRQIIVCINKMDSVQFAQSRFESLCEEYSKYLDSINMQAKFFIPIAARHGDNVAQASKSMPWYEGPSVLQALDDFVEEKHLAQQPLRMPVQDVYKFTAMNDNRRLCAGRVDSGKIAVGDELLFLPSLKRATVKSIERFAAAQDNTAEAGESVTLTLSPEIFIKRGELACKINEKLPHVANQFRAKIFWMSKRPLRSNQPYVLKLGTTKIEVKLNKVQQIFDEKFSANQQRTQVERHEVADCILETLAPVVFDLNHEQQATSQFVIVDDYVISGGGIIVDHVLSAENESRQDALTREVHFIHSKISAHDREKRYAQRPILILVSGDESSGHKEFARLLEQTLFLRGCHTYYLGVGSLKYGLDQDLPEDITSRGEHIRRLAEVAFLFLDSGAIFIASARNLTEQDVNIIESLNPHHEVLVVSIGQEKPNAKHSLVLAKPRQMQDGIAQVMQWLINSGNISAMWVC